jgi:voltage-gated potassium channel
MSDSFRRIYFGAIFFAITLIVSVAGYMMLGWHLVDAVYTVVTIVFGGNGNLKPIDSTAAKLFTVWVLVAGTTSAAYIIGGFLQMVTEGEINRALQAKRKNKGIENLTNHAIICGYGRIGQILAQQLHEAKQSLVIIDNSPDRLESAEEAGFLVYLGNAAEEEVLQAVRIDRAKVLATVLPDDAMNVFITLTARGLNRKLMILARGEKPSTETKLRLAGATQVVLPAAISAAQMGNLITHPTAFELLRQDGGHNILNDLLSQMDLQFHEVTVSDDSGAIGATIGELEVRGHGNFIIVALRQSSGDVITHPSNDWTLAKGDRLLVMGHQDDFPQLSRRSSAKSQLRYRGVQT